MNLLLPQPSSISDTDINQKSEKILNWLTALYSEDLYDNIENIKLFEENIKNLSVDALTSKQFYDILKDLAQNPHRDFLLIYLQKLRKLRLILKEHFNPNRLMYVLEIFCYNINSEIRMLAFFDKNRPTS